MDNQSCGNKQLTLCIFPLDKEKDEQQRSLNSTKAHSLKDLPKELLEDIILNVCKTSNDIKDLLNVNILSRHFHDLFQHRAATYCVAFAENQNIFERVILENTFQIRVIEDSFKGYELIWLQDGRSRNSSINSFLDWFTRAGGLKPYGDICRLDKTAEYVGQDIIRRVKTKLLGAELRALYGQILPADVLEENIHLNVAPAGTFLTSLAVIEAVRSHVSVRWQSRYAYNVAVIKTLVAVHTGMGQYGVAWFMKAVQNKTFQTFLDFGNCFELDAMNDEEYDAKVAGLRVTLGAALNTSFQGKRIWEQALCGPYRAGFDAWMALVPNEAALDGVLRDASWSIKIEIPPPQSEPPRSVASADLAPTNSVTHLSVDIEA